MFFLLGAWSSATKNVWDKQCKYKAYWEATTLGECKTACQENQKYKGLKMCTAIAHCKTEECPTTHAPCYFYECPKEVLSSP